MVLYTIHLSQNKIKSLRELSLFCLSSRNVCVNTFVLNSFAVAGKNNPATLPAKMFFEREKKRMNSKSVCSGKLL